MSIWTPFLLVGSDLPDLEVMQWGPGVSAGDQFLALGRGDLADRSVQVDGNFAGAVLGIVGSNTATTNSNGNYYPLHDPFDNILTIIAPGIYQIMELTAWMKPQLVGGSSSTSLTITACQKISK